MSRRALLSKDISADSVIRQVSRPTTTVEFGQALVASIAEAIEDVASKPIYLQINGFRGKVEIKQIEFSDREMKQ